MAIERLQIITDALSGSASFDTAVSRAILQQVSDGVLPETLQVGTPHRVVAFGKHDALTNGFEEAVTIASSHGFDPTIRIAGGRAVVFHPQTVRFTWTVPTAEPVVGMKDRFATVAEYVVATLESLDIPAAIGELEGEYCPGPYSVHIEGGGKVMGSGQRLTRAAAQISGMIVVDNAVAVNDVLVPIYSTLGLTMDPTKTGALTDSANLEAGTVAEAFAQNFSVGREVFRGHVDTATAALATQFQPSHDPRELA